MIELAPGVQLVRRPEWGARPPRAVVRFTPSFGTTVHWEGPHMGGFGHDRCAELVRTIQSYHMDAKGWTDIAYHAVACPHGYAFEGRWVGVRGGANGTPVGNSTAYAVCYLGGQGDPFTDEAERAVRAVRDTFRRVGGAGPGSNCHRDWKATQCPGDVICSWVRLGMPVEPLPQDPTPPQPQSIEEDQMYLYTAPNKPVFVLHAGVSVGLNEASDLETFRNAHVPELQLDDDTYQKFRERYPGA